MKIADLLDQLNIPNQLPPHRHCREGWCNVDCFRCSPGTSKFKLGIPENGAKTTHCWSCGPFSLAHALVEITGQTYQQLRPLLKDIDFGGPLLPTVKKQGKLVLPKGLGPLLPAHIKYLKRRKFNPTELERLWNLQGIGIASNLAWRILIPIQHNGKTVSWTTRSIQSGAKLRYVAATPEQEAIAAHSLLFGEQFCNHSAIVCEGPFDAMRIGPGAVATMGLGYSQSQLIRMSKFANRTIVFDNEPAAQLRARKLCDDLSVLPGKTRVVELDAKDPGSAGPKEVLALRRFLK